MSKTDDQIAKEICGWEQANVGLWWAGEMNPRKFSPSTEIADAIEALKSLPSNFGWRLISGAISRDFICAIWWDFCKNLLCEHQHENAEIAICRALLDKRVLAAVKVARKAVKK